MKRIPYSNLLLATLGLVLMASIGLNIYQLYYRDNLLDQYEEAQYSEEKVSAVLEQLSICHHDAARKDSIIAALEHHEPDYSASLSVQRSP